jgi:type I site-specific restriction-modification system R (restriction) subunit
VGGGAYRLKGDGKGGTYFGATGCGKTYAMLFLSRLLTLRERESFNNPAIIIIEDREDLDTQTSELFAASKKYLHDTNVRSIENRQDLMDELGNKASGGVYITTIQKFCEKTGLLSNRNNIICISDEAHRSQSGIGAKLKKTDQGVFTTYGFAKYLRDGFPNATYCGFTGTPIDEKIKMVATQSENDEKELFDVCGTKEYRKMLDKPLQKHSDELIKIFSELQNDKSSFEAMGITYEEKAFYDILVKVRDEHDFKYEGVSRMSIYTSTSV